MKKYSVLIIILLLLIGCTKETEITKLSWPEEEVTIFVSSDLHWQTEESNARPKYLNETIATLFYEAINKSPEALILCGDLANSGKLNEHIELVEMLEEVEAQGTEVFVVMGNHDVDSNVLPKELIDIYGEFGFNGALSYDDDSMSYVTELNNEIWLMSLDFNLYGDKESDMAAMVTNKTLQWIEENLKKAAKEKVMVIPFAHHNLIENSMKGFNHHYNIENGEELSELFLKYGIPIYLSGHKHNSFIDSKEGYDSKVYEIVSDAPMNYPYRYTTLTFNNNKTIDYNVPKLDVEAWANDTGVLDEDILNFSEKSKELSEISTRENAKIAVENITDNKEERDEMIDYYIEVLSSFRNRTLWQNREKLKNDSALLLWKKYENENIFGKWIPWILNNGINDKQDQVIYWE